MSANRLKDRRVARTDALLHEALTGLVHEKPYDEIAVKEILDRANIGRSTFYTHFRDKDDLLVSSIRDMLSATERDREDLHRASPTAALLWFALPIFEHIEARRRGGQMPVGGDGRRAMHEQLRRAIVELVTDGLASARPRGGREAIKMPPDLLASWVAVTFVQVLDWWVERGERLPARDAEDRFRQLVEPSLSKILT